MQQLVFAFWVSDHTATHGRMLAASLREFGGDYADSRVVAMFPQGRLSSDWQASFGEMGVEAVPFHMDETALRFPLAVMALGAGAAEAHVGQGGLVWIDPFSLILNEPTPMVLPPDKTLGYRPVDHTLIGSLYQEPLDAFWSFIYEECGVDPINVFPMWTMVDDRRLRAYLNAGTISVRAQDGWLRRWAETFERLYQSAALQHFYEADQRYAIFAHQAILTGVILAGLKEDDLELLSHCINYPLHMHADVPDYHRVARLNDLISGRYDTLFENQDWEQRIPVEEPLLAWLRSHVERGTAQ